MSPSFEPDPQQQQVLDHATGNLLVTGKAGSGKTWTLIERFARLIESGADPLKVALVVGSRRARDDARAALFARLPGSLPAIQVWTIHGLGFHVVRSRYQALGYEDEPAVLSAPDQFNLVRELLDGEDPKQWPAYGNLLQIRGFADEVRQFLLRAEEALASADEIRQKAAALGLTGWDELARFLQTYQDVLDQRGKVDFAGMLQLAARGAASGEPLFDHLLVDDYQDATLAEEALIAAIACPDTVIAGEPAAHVFSFQGTTDAPILSAISSGGPRIELATVHRSPGPVQVDAWSSVHSSEEHAAISRELRRIHVEDGVDWSELAVVVRRQGPHLSGLVRALDDANVPRHLPESGLSLGAEPATLPYVLALRWIARPSAREQMIESVLTTDLVGLSPAAARGLIRASQAAGLPRAAALQQREGLTPDEKETIEIADDVLRRAEAVAATSVLDAFAILWRELPCSARLVQEAERDDRSRVQLAAVVSFSEIVSKAGSGTDPSTEAFLEALEAGEHGPGFGSVDPGTPDAVQVLTAHAASGREFDTVVIAGATEGNFPSLTRPEPMFDLSVLDGPIARSERNRARLQDERRLFDMVIARARRRVILTAAAAHDDDPEPATRSRFADEMKVAWMPSPSPPFTEPVSVREAAALWRRTLASPEIPAAQRLSALQGLVALGVDPSGWWFQLDWTDTGRPLHEELRLSYSKLSTLENCELQHVLRDELGLGRPAGYQAWVGKTVHKLIEECERGKIPKEPKALTEELDSRWREQEFPSHAVSEAYRYVAKTRMLKNWFDRYAKEPALSVERFFEFEFEGTTIVGFIDRIGPTIQGGTCITDFKSGNADHAPKAEESLQLGIYALAVSEAEDLAEFRPVKAVELAYLKGNWRTGEIELRRWQVNQRAWEDYQTRVRETLSALIDRERALNLAETYQPNPYADCYFCEFKTLCPLYPEGSPALEGVS